MIKQLIKFFYNNAILNDSQLNALKKDNVFKFFNLVSMEMGHSASHKGHITKLMH